MSDGRNFRLRRVNQLRMIVASLAIALCGAQAARADFVFVGGNPGTNANGTNSDFFNAVDGWVNTGSNYALTPPTSGPDPNTGAALPTMNINTGVAGTGAVFDPASESSTTLALFGMSGTTFNTNGKVYVDSNNAGPGSATYTTAFPSNPDQTTVANFFDIKSGEFHLDSVNQNSNIMIVGRSAAGTLMIDGGTMVVDTSIQVAGDGSNVQQTGTIVYNGGVLQAGLNPSGASSPGIRLGNGAACTGTFVDYNKGSGNITLGGFYMAKTASAGSVPTIATVEFHYDNGGTRPIQIHNSAANAQLSIRNATGQSSRLNFVLDSNPTMTVVNGTEVPQNLGLFSTDTISGNDIASEFFYDPTGTTLLGESAPITERAPNGFTYTWDISYKGAITFSDPVNSIVSSVTGPNNLLGSTTTGTDVVLMGVSAIAPLTGDANGDGIVNAVDFGILQTNYGHSISGGYAAADFNDDGVVNADDFAIYQLGVAQYNAGNHTAVPEPASIALLSAIPCLAIRKRQQVI